MGMRAKPAGGGAFVLLRTQSDIAVKDCQRGPAWLFLPNRS